MHGGELIARVLSRQGVELLFTLCGGHISPILVAAKERGIRVVDVRHEASAVFAADAVARLTGVPGVAAVTAGPGATNTVTAVKNAQLAQSPVVLLGGATGTILAGRGSLQDIDQRALFAPHVKWQASASRVSRLVPLLEEAFWQAQEGVPGPVFLECPVDLLYPREVVQRLYGAAARGGSRGISSKALKWYLGTHVAGLFSGAGRHAPAERLRPEPPALPLGALRRAGRALQRAERPVLMVGSQALLEAEGAAELAAAVERLGVPVYLSGMARGLLGRDHPLQLRHQRRRALKEADLVVLAGVPCDFRLEYGRQISSRARLVAANRSRDELRRNRRPEVAVEADPALFLRRLASGREARREWGDWLEALKRRDREREEEIDLLTAEETDRLNPLALCRAVERAVPDNGVLVVDGGDFVGTASYLVSPRGPLSWLDPGVFGTLGVGAGFALGAKLCRPDSEVWLLWGDGSAAYSLAEFDTFVRHGVPVVALVGNDASWAQIAREQVEILGDDVGTVLRRTDYHVVAEGYGGKGFLLDSAGRTDAVLAAAREEAARGRPVLINALLGRTDFRKGSISL